MKSVSKDIELYLSYKSQTSIQPARHTPRSNQVVNGQTPFQGQTRWSISMVCFTKWKRKYETKFGEKNMCQSIFVFVFFSFFNRSGLKMCRHRIIATMHRSANLIYLQRIGPMARYIWEFGIAAHYFTDTPSTEKLTLNLAQVDRPDEVNEPVCPITCQSRVKHYIWGGGIAKPPQ